MKSLDVEGCAALVRKVASLVKENQRLRIKHSDDPTKFLEVVAVYDDSLDVLHFCYAE